LDVPVPKTKGRGSTANAYIHACVECLLSLLSDLKTSKISFFCQGSCAQDEADSKYLCETYEKDIMWKSESAYTVAM